MQKIIILLFLVASFANADLKEKIEEVNDRVKSTGTAEEPCDTCVQVSRDAEKDPGPLLRSCVEGICPKDEANLVDLYNKTVVRMAKGDAAFDKELKPLIVEANKEAARSDNKILEELLGWLKTNPKLAVPGHVRMFRLIADMNDSDRFDISQSDEKYVVNAEKSRKSFPELSDEQFDKRVTLIKRYVEQMNKPVFSSKDPAVVRMLYGKDLDQYIQSTIDSIKERKKRLSENPEFGFITQIPTFQDFLNEDKIKKEISSSALNSDAIDNLNSRNAVLNFYLDVAENKSLNELLSADPIDLKQYAEERDFESHVKRVIQKNNRLIAKPDPKQLDSCKAALAIAKEGLPTKGELEAYEKRADAIKNLFFEKTKNMVCKEDQKKYAEEVKAWEPKYPLTQDQFFDQMKKSLKQNLDGEKRMDANRGAFKNSELKDVLYAMRMHSSGDEDTDLKTEADDVCRNLSPELIPDATLFYEKAYVVGPLAVKFKNMESVTHHELGHKFMYFIAQSDCEDKEWYAKVISCLKSNHTEQEISPYSPYNQSYGYVKYTQYDKEDWADLISGHVLPDKNQACAYTKKKNEEEYAKLSLKNEHEEDSHSSHLFRLLHLEFLKNDKLPIACSEGLAAKGEKADFKNCLK